MAPSPLDVTIASLASLTELPSGVVGSDVANLAGWLNEHFPDLDATPYPCQHCDKSFKRSDVRAKHVLTMHPGVADVGSSGDSEGPRKAPKREYDISPHSTFAQPLPPLARRASSVSDTHYNPLHVSDGTMNPRWATDNAGPSSAGTAPLPMFTSPAMPVSSSVNMLVNQPSVMLSSQPTSGSFSMPSGPTTGFLDPAGLLPGSSLQPNTNMLDTSQTDLFDPLSSEWPFFSHIFGWGLDSDIDTDLGIQPNMFENSQFGPTTSTENLSAAWLLSITPRHGSPTGEGKEHEEAKRDPFGRNHDNPWPNIFKPKMPDRPLTLGGVKASPRADRARNTPLPIETTSRNAMLSLVYLSHQNMWLMPDIEDFPDQETLSDFVDLYFERFHHTFPFLHRPTFRMHDTSAVLLLAIAAVGATYADSEFRPLAVALSELVRRIVQWMRASDQRSKFDRNLLISYMLQSAVGVACGSREMMLHSEISRCSLVTSMRRLHLLRPGRSAIDELMAKGVKPSVEERWQAWIEDESTRRLGWAIYLLDAQMAALLGIPAIAAVNEAGVALPCDERLWEAPDAQSWWTVQQEVVTSGLEHDAPFASMLRGVMGGRGDLRGMSDFGRAIIAHSLYRLSLDTSLIKNVLAYEDVGLNLNGTLLNSKPYLALQHIARDDAPLSSPSHLRLSNAALYHHSRLAFASPGFLEHIKAASGKLEPDITKNKARIWLEDWAKDGRNVRRAVWHAGVLNALLAEFPLGAFSEVFWSFDCALVFWAVIRYGGESLKPGGIRSALFAANWFDVEPPVMWIDHGGQLILPFVGSSANFTSRDILDHFIMQLKKMPWGMAAMYKQVLEKLAVEHEDT